MVAAAVIGAGVATAAASTAAGAMGASAAKSAASTQAAAAQQAAQLQEQQYQQTRSDLAPYNQSGQAALGTLNSELPSLTAQWNPTEANLEQTPGYQFTLDQGLKSVQNSAAARGLGVSGAALKGAASYATGLADSTWQDVANNYYTGQNNAYNKLLGVAQMGEQAAAQTGQYGTQTAQLVGNDITSAGNAQAAGTVGAANAINGGVTSAASSLGNSGLNYLLYSKLLTQQPQTLQGTGDNTGKTL